jgi:hypothetical protein
VFTVFLRSLALLSISTSCVGTGVFPPHPIQLSIGDEFVLIPADFRAWKDSTSLKLDPSRLAEIVCVIFKVLECASISMAKHPNAVTIYSMVRRPTFCIPSKYSTLVLIPDYRNIWSLCLSHSFSHPSCSSRSLSRQSLFLPHLFKADWPPSRE